MSSSTLVVGPAWVGDMVMAQSLFKLLRDRHPEQHIDVVAPPWSQPLVGRMPEVRRAFALDVSHGQLGLAARWRLGRELRATRYERAIILPRSFKAALVPFFAGVRQRTGFRGELRYLLLNDLRERGEHEQTVARFLTLGLPRGETPPAPPQPRLRIDTDNQRELAQQLELDPGRPSIALLPGAEYGPAKCWPLENFGALAASLLEAGLAVWVLGSSRDLAAAEQICRIGGSGIRNFCGQTRLEDAVDLLALAQVAVSNDSGLMHVAAATGIHVTAVYGSTSPALTPPLTASRTIHYLDLECSPCFQRECPLGHLRCLREISVSSVLAAVTGAL